MIIIITTAIFALVLAFILGTALGFFKEFFAVPQDPYEQAIRSALPGANCGACGFPGCESYAREIASGKAGITACPVGGSGVIEKLAGITGQAAKQEQPVVPVLVCQGSFLHTPRKGKYTGMETCRGAKLAAGSTKLCTWGCLGYGDCTRVCKFGAIRMNVKKGLPRVDYKKCTSCRMCISECPQGILAGIPFNQKGAIPLCSNVSPDKKRAAKSCRIACIKCELCVRSCPKQCIVMKNNIPVVDWSKCDSCRVCVEKCPTKVFTLLEQIKI